jgi:3-methyladenine DNA glycosylase AlkD
MVNSGNIRKVIRSKADPVRAKNSAWFFKTGKGDYGEGDKFLGIKVPICRQIAKEYRDLGYPELEQLLQSKYHEERLTALLILVQKFSRAEEKERSSIFKFYLAHTAYINNWDLVDLSAPKIVGPFLLTRDKNILLKLARSKSIWERRISIIATFPFIKDKFFDATLELAEILLSDKHDLIQKAVGWALREVGNKDIAKETSFLNNRYKTMPRTTLRYAIEKFPEEVRRAYLNGSM